MEAPSPTRLVTTSNSITEGRKLAACRSFADTNELHIVKKSPDKQDMYAYMVRRSQCWEGGHKTNQPPLWCRCTCICKVTDAASLSPPILAESQPTKKSRLRMCLQEGSEDEFWTVWILTLLPTTVGFTNYSAFGVKPVLLGVKNYLEPLIWLNVLMLNFVTQVRFLVVVITVCIGQFKVSLW